VPDVGAVDDVVIFDLLWAILADGRNGDAPNFPREEHPPVRKASQRFFNIDPGFPPR
jgi:hypothetical protein